MAGGKPREAAGLHRSVPDFSTSSRRPSDDGIDELKDMLRAARITTETLYPFPDNILDDAERVTRIKVQSPR